MGAEIVIAVDVIGDECTFSAMIQTMREHRYIPSGLASTLEVMLRSLDVMMKDIHRHRLTEAAPDIVIRPDIPPGVSVLIGFSQAGDAIAAGERATAEALPKIEERLKRLPI
jgi:predicted acylesterase/phospholipase RssA